MQAALPECEGKAYPGVEIRIIDIEDGKDVGQGAIGEVPVAFIEVRSGHTVTEEELIGFCQGQIARYKIPRRVHFNEPGNWPVSATKINRRALRAMLAGTGPELAT